MFDSGFYLRALDENHVYDRVYSEVLQDPSLQEKMTNLLGGTSGVPPGEAERLLRQVFPPDYLQRQFERNVPAVLAYLRGDEEELVVALELGPVLDNIRPVAVEYAANRLQSAVREQAASPEAYAAHLAGVADGLRRGEIPAEIPMIELSEDQQAAAVAAILGEASATEAERAAVAQALAAGDTAGALAAALDPLLRQRTDDSLIALREHLGPGDTLDLVEQAASDNGQTKRELLSDFEPVRDAVGTANSWGIPLTSGSVALAVLLLALLYLPSRRRALAVAGAALLAMGLLAATGWYFQREVAPDRAQEAIAEIASEDASPARPMAADVARSLIRDTSSSTWPPAVAALFVGAAAIVLACRLRPARGDPPWAAATDGMAVSDDDSVVGALRGH